MRLSGRQDGPRVRASTVGLVGVGHARATCAPGAGVWLDWNARRYARRGVPRDADKGGISPDWKGQGDTLVAAFVQPQGGI